MEQSNVALIDFKKKDEEKLNNVIHFGKEYYLGFEDLKWCYILYKHGYCFENKNGKSCCLSLPLDVVKKIFIYKYLDVFINNKYITFDDEYAIETNRSSFPLKIHVTLLKNPFIDFFTHSKKVFKRLKKENTFPFKCKVATSIFIDAVNEYTLVIGENLKWYDTDIFFPFSGTSFLEREHRQYNPYEVVMSTICIYDAMESKEQKKDIIKKINLIPPAYSAYRNTYVIQKENGFYIVTMNTKTMYDIIISKKNFLDLKKPEVNIYYLSSLKEDATLVETVPLPFIIRTTTMSSNTYSLLENFINIKHTHFALYCWYNSTKFINGQLIFEFSDCYGFLPEKFRNRPPLIIRWVNDSLLLSGNATMNVDKEIEFIATLFGEHETVLSEGTLLKQNKKLLKKQDDDNIILESSSIGSPERISTDNVNYANKSSDKEDVTDSINATETVQICLLENNENITSDDNALLNKGDKDNTIDHVFQQKNHVAKKPSDQNKNNNDYFFINAAKKIKQLFSAYAQKALGLLYALYHSIILNIP